MSSIRISPRLVSLFNQSASVVVLTGAGISAESSIPTFRDALTGLWTHYSPEQLATPEAFQRNPLLVWKWYQFRRDLILAATPNAGHRALVEMEKYFKSFVIITQNVDGLHESAGSSKIIELHGNISKTKCVKCHVYTDTKHETWKALDDKELPPKCKCGSNLRPAVVWFNEQLNPLDLQSSEDFVAKCDVLFSIGTSSLVYPAAALGESAKTRGKIVVEINTTETPLTPLCDYVLRGTSSLVLSTLLKHIQDQKASESVMG